MLAEKGYDVWLGNFRGNPYGLKHATLQIKHSAFWRFSVDCFGNYDIPAMIDYILSKTGHSKVQLIGYDIGGTSILAMMHHQPNYCKKIQNIQMIAPLGYMLNTENQMALSIGSLASTCSYDVIYSFLIYNRNLNDK